MNANEIASTKAMLEKCVVVVEAHDGLLLNVGDGELLPDDTG